MCPGKVVGRTFPKGHQVSLGMRQVEWKPGWSTAVEHLPGMHTAPGSMPSPERGKRLFSPFIGLLSAKNSQPLPGSQHQARGAKHPRTEPSKTMSQNKPFLGKRSLRGGRGQERQGNYLTPEGEAFRVSGQQDCHTKSITQTARYQKKAGCAPIAA